MALLGTLSVNVVAKTDKFNRGINNSRKSLSRFSNTARKATSFVKGFVGAFAAGVGIYGVTRSLSAAAAEMDKLAKTSDKLGIASERLAGLQLAASQTGVETTKLHMALQRMTRRVAEAAQDTGEAQAALKELGLNARELNRMSPDQMFRRIATAMSAVEGQSNKVRLAFKLFDSEGVDLVNTLNLGAAGLEKMQKEAERLGTAIKREDLAKVEAFSNAMDKLGKAFKGLAGQIVIDIAPAAVRAIEDLGIALDVLRHPTGAGRPTGIPSIYRDISAIRSPAEARQEVAQRQHAIRELRRKQRGRIVANEFAYPEAGTAEFRRIRAEEGKISEHLAAIQRIRVLENRLIMERNKTIQTGFTGKLQKAVVRAAQLGRIGRFTGENIGGGVIGGVNRGIEGLRAGGRAGLMQMLFGRTATPNSVMEATLGGGMGARTPAMNEALREGTREAKMAEKANERMREEREREKKKLKAQLEIAEAAKKTELHLRDMAGNVIGVYQVGAV